MKPGVDSFLRYPPLYCLAGGLAALYPPVRQDFWWGIAALGGMVAMYAWLARGDSSSERIESGDNCYFIGFVYTLLVIALSAGLDAEFLLVENSRGGPKQLLQTVGIALGTSVIGMMFRFGLAHGAKTLDNEFDRAIVRAAAAANKLEAAIIAIEGSAQKLEYSVNSVVTEMNNYETGIRGHAETVRAEAEHIGEHFNKLSEDLIQGFSARLADTLQKGHFDGIREDMEKAAAEYQLAISGVGKMLSQSVETLGQAGEAAKSNARLAEQALTALEQAASSGRWQSLSESAEVFTAQLEKMNEGLRQLAAQQEAVMAVAGGDVENLQKLRDAFSGLVEDLRSDVQAAADIKEEYRKEFQKAATSALSETHQLYARLIGGAEVALSQMNDLGALSDSLKVIAKRLEKLDK